MNITEIQAQENIKENLKYIMGKFDVKSQKEMAFRLGVGEGQLSKIINGSQTPTVFPFLANVKRNFGCSIDEFLFTNMREEEERQNGITEDIPMASFMRFGGLYQMYYFNTSSAKGREYDDDVESLRSGLMLISPIPDCENKYNVVAVFNMRKEAADDYYKRTQKELGNLDLKKEDYKNEGYENASQYIKSLDVPYHIYYGELELSAKFVYISLKYENTKDRVQMIFHFPVSNSKKYIGGLGTVTSISRGRKASPCVQYIALSEKSLPTSVEEIASHLLMHYPRIKTYDAIDEVVDMLIQLYQEDEDEFAGALTEEDVKRRLLLNEWKKKKRLTNEQKKTLVGDHVNKIVNETVERNLFRTVVVSDDDDDYWYHYVKRAIANMR